MRKTTVRNATLADVKEMARLHHDAWKIAYAPILTREHLEWVSIQRETQRKQRDLKKGTPLLVAEEDGQIAGFILYEEVTDSKTRTIEIHSFWVHHEMTRKGIGSVLLDEVIRRENPELIHVWVLTGVDAGPAFYIKNGFILEEDTRQDFVFLDVPLPMARFSRVMKKRRASIRKKK